MNIDIYTYLILYILYLLTGCYIFTKYKDADINNLFYDFFKTHSNKIVRFTIGIFISFILIIVLLILFHLWPILYVIRLYNERDSKLKDQLKQKRYYKRQEERERKYKGFNLDLFNPIIIERNDSVSEEISKEFPTNTILFVSEKPNVFVESFFKKNLEEIKIRFLESHPNGNKYNFIIPDGTIWDNYTYNVLEKKLAYNFPSLRNIDGVLKLLKKSSIYDFTTNLCEDLQMEFSMKPGLFRVVNSSGSNYTSIRFSYVELPIDSEANLDKALWYYLFNLKEKGSDVFFKKFSQSEYEKYLVKGNQSHKLADIRFDYHAHKLSKEIKDKIDALKFLGYENILVKSILNNIKGYEIKKKERPDNPFGKKISSIVITQNFKIYLPDYNNIEIKFPALSKALYLLFLRHPEGIILKHLSDHKSELLKIYQAISLRISYSEAIASVEDMINPLSNSVNEKASRIKSAFVKLFSEDIARYYYITGKRGNKKAITLKRSLVDWRNNELDWPFKESKTIKKSEKEEQKINKKYSHALELISNNDYEKARSILTDIIELNNNYFDAYKLRAICHFELLNYKLAERDEDKAIELNPNTSVCHHNRAETRLMLGKHQDALDDVTKYLKDVDDRCAESYYIRGLIYFELGSEKAKQDFVNAKSLGHMDASKMLKQCQGRVPRKPKF